MVDFFVGVIYVMYNFIIYNDVVVNFCVKCYENDVFCVIICFFLYFFECSNICVVFYNSWDFGFCFEMVF